MVATLSGGVTAAVLIGVSGPMVGAGVRGGAGAAPAVATPAATGCTAGAMSPGAEATGNAADATEPISCEEMTGAGPVETPLGCVVTHALSSEDTATATPMEAARGRRRCRFKRKSMFLVGGGMGAD